MARPSLLLAERQFCGEKALKGAHELHETLEHALPRLSLRYLGDLLRCFPGARAGRLLASVCTSPTALATPQGPVMQSASCASPIYSEKNEQASPMTRRAPRNNVSWKLGKGSSGLQGASLLGRSSPAPKKAEKVRPNTTGPAHNLLLRTRPPST